MPDLVFAKLGGSLITDKSRPYTLRDGVLPRLVAEVAEALGTGEVRLLLGHGAGSFPHQSAARFQTHLGLLRDDSVRGLCEVSRDVFRLDRVVIDALLDGGVAALPLQPSAAAWSSGGSLVDWQTRPIERALAVGLVPVVFGDVSLDERMGVCITSTEDEFVFLAGRLAPRRIVMAARVPGVLDARGAVVPTITPATLEPIRAFLRPTEGADVTGGMLHKIERLLDLARRGCETIIVSGLEPGRLRDAILGRPVEGTRISA